MPKQVVCPDSGKRMTASIHTLTVCCPACGQYVRLRKDGRMMKHKPGSQASERQQTAVNAIRQWKEDRES